MLKPSRVSGSSSKLGKRRGSIFRIFSQGHTPTQFDKFWKKSLECDGKPPDENWEKSYKIQYKKLFEPYIIMVSVDVPLYDERFQGYGLNKVSHLATVAAQKGE